jgi:guanylate kinase
MAKAGYRNISAADADSLATQGQVIYENFRYGNRYIVDSAEIERLISAALIPVLHLGQIAGVRAVRKCGSWLAVSLNCSRETTLSRARARGDADVSDRLDAWDQTAADLAENPDFKFDLFIDSETTKPRESARNIFRHFVRCSVASANRLSGE